MKSSPLEPFIKVLLWKSSLQLWPQWQVVGADCISVLFKKAGLTLSYVIRMVNLSCLTHKEKKKNAFCEEKMCSLSIPIKF